MEEENEYETARLRRIAANKAKLKSLGVLAAVEAVAAPLEARREQAAAAKRAKHAAATEVPAPVQRRRTGRAAALNARSKLLQQITTSASSCDDDSASESRLLSSLEASASEDMEVDASVVSDASKDVAKFSGRPGRQPGMADPLSAQTCNVARPSNHRSTAGLRSNSAAGPNNEDEDEELRQALQLSLADLAPAQHQSYSRGSSHSDNPSQLGRTIQQVPDGSNPRDDHSGSLQPNGASQSDGNADALTGLPSVKSSSKKRSRAGKAGRQLPAPPTDAELSAVFSMLNPKRMSAIISSDIKQVASEVLLIEHEPEQLHNMMVRAGEVLGLEQQLRLGPKSFMDLARYYLS